MSFIGLRIPHETARLLAEVDLGGVGDPEPPGNFHITLACLGDEVPIEQVARALLPLYEVARTTKPFTVGTHRTTTFPPHPETGSVPIICPIESKPLHELHARLCEALDEADVEYSKKFPVFKPHVTLAYADDPAVHTEGLAKRQFCPVTWGAHELVLWGGDHGDDKLTVTLPFTLRAGKEAAFRARASTANHTYFETTEGRVFLRHLLER